MKKERKFNQQDNLTLISLIKRKVEPLKKIKVDRNVLEQHRHSHETQASRTFHAQNCQESLPPVPKARIYGLNKWKGQQQSNLVQRAKHYLQQKRKENQIPDERKTLDEYITIFSRPISQKQRVKRQSIEACLIRYEKQQIQGINSREIVGFMDQKIDFNDDQRSVLNAKIRVKLNHKKIIDLLRKV